MPNAIKCDDALHCWHVTSSTTDGLAQKGYHLEICCWCGLRRKNHWKIVPDVTHGGHYRLSKEIRDVKYEYEPAGRLVSEG
jgi:hypothetical protein